MANKFTKQERVRNKLADILLKQSEFILLQIHKSKDSKIDVSKIFNALENNASKLELELSTLKNIEGI